MLVEIDRKVGNVGATALVAALIVLVGVGAFPSGSPVHLPVAIGFYLLATYGIALLGTEQILGVRVRSGVVGLWIAIVIHSTWFLWALAVALWFPGGLALPEPVGALLIGVWFVRAAAETTETDA